MRAPVLSAAARILTGASIRWVDCQADPRQRVYFANHTSHLDTWVLWAALPAEVRDLTRPVAAMDYWAAGPVRRYLATRVFQAVLVERSNVTKENNPLDLLLKAMGDHHSLIFFPEGGRNPGPEVREFKCGLYHLARNRPDVEFVPVYLENLNRVLPKGEFLPVPLLCRITFGAPMRLRQGESKGAFLERARQSLCALKER